MQRIILTLLGSIMACGAIAQTITGKVSDLYSRSGLEGVLVTNLTNGKMTTTGKNGTFNLIGNEGNVFRFHLLGYEDQEVPARSTPMNILLQPGNYNLNTVEVSSSRIENNENQRVPQSIAVVSSKDLQRFNGVFLEEPMNLIPGVRMDKRTMSGGQRITIRGYGNASNFTGTGYKAYINGIPLTDAEGNTFMDDIDFASLGQVEVIKGPSSTSYGMGIAGVVKMQTLIPERKGTTIYQDAMGGSFGLFRSNTRIGINSDQSQWLVSYGHQTYDSYRVHSASKKDFLSVNGHLDINEKTSVGLYISWNKSYDQLAGQLDSAEFFGKENVAEAPYVNNDGRVQYETQRVGTTIDHVFSERLRQRTTLFYSGYTQDQAFAVGLNQKMSQNVGGRTELQWDGQAGNTKWTGVVGTEIQQSRSFAKSYGLSNNILGSMRSDLQNRALNYMFFTEWSLPFGNSWELTAGASANFLEFSIRDLMANPSNSNHSDVSGYKTFDPVITPRIALTKAISENLSAYANVSMGYTPPSISDITIPYTGEVNLDLKPENAFLTEVGIKGRALKDRLSYQIALYRMSIDNKLTPRSVADTGGTILYTYSVNTGSQEHYGAEVSLNWTIYQSEAGFLRRLQAFANYAWSNFTYVDVTANAGIEGAADYSGNAVMGVAPHQLNAGFNLDLKGGFYANITYQYLDQVPVTFDNRHYAPSFSLLDARAGYRSQWGDHWIADIFVGGNNLTGSLYYTMVFLNWERGPQPAIYLPGPYESTYFGGVSVKYNF